MCEACAQTVRHVVLRNVAVSSHARHRRRQCLTANKASETKLPWILSLPLSASLEELTLQLIRDTSLNAKCSVHPGFGLACHFGDRGILSKCGVRVDAGNATAVTVVGDGCEWIGVLFTASPVDRPCFKRKSVHCLCEETSQVRINSPTIVDSLGKKVPCLLRIESQRTSQ